MRLLVAVLAVFVGGSAGQQYYGSAPLRPIAPFRFSSHERVVSQGRIAVGPPAIRASYERTGNPCVPTPCGPNTDCTVSRKGIAQCRCLDGYVPIDNTIQGCKPQCVSDGECPDDYRCRQNSCVRVCVPGACGLNADCDARNHQAVCSCPNNYFGNPDVSCQPEVKEVRVQPPSPPIEICARGVCGINADCREQGDRPVCSCPLGYEGDPLSHCRRGECIENHECPGDSVCRGLRCVRPCDDRSICGVNAVCKTQNHQPICSCPQGYTGDPMRSCRVHEPCNPSPCGHNTHCKVRNNRAVCSCYDNYIGDPLTSCRPECERDTDCSPLQSCENNLCVNPCRRGACGEGAYCDVKNHRAVCTCPDHFLGSPHTRCYTECTEHDDCPYNQACVAYKCINPCESDTCGIGANCAVKNHAPICSCPSSHTGDPFKACRLFTDDDYCNPNPCGTSANCQVGFDKRTNEKKAVCTCPTGYIGNPLISCAKGECDDHNQCPMTQACYQYRCTSVCHFDGKSVCGEGAQCKAQNHKPVCSCPRGYSGSPLQRCYIGSGSGIGGGITDYDDDDRRYRSSVYSYGS